MSEEELLASGITPSTIRLSIGTEHIDDIIYDHQANTPLVSNSSYPTSNSNYGIAVNVSLAR